MSRNHKYDNEEIKKRYLEGEDAVDLANDLGCSSTCIYYRLRKMGVKRRKNKEINHPKFDKEFILEKYDSGLRAEEIAKIIGCDRRTVYYYLEKNNYVKNLKNVDVDEENLIALYRKGVSTTKLSKIFGFSSASLGNRLKKLGEKMRKSYDYPMSEELKKRFSDTRKGKGSPTWKGGRRIDPDGYIIILDTTGKFSARKYIQEHRMVIILNIGRKLKDREEVHHWNGDRKDNRLENLCLFHGRTAHQRLHGFARRHKIKIEELKFEQPWLYKDNKQKHEAC